MKIFKNIVEKIAKIKDDKNSIKENELLYISYYDDMKTVKNRLESVRSRFDLATDEDIVDALIFEEKSLLAHYEYLIKKSKSLGIKPSNNIPIKL